MRAEFLRYIAAGVANTVTGYVVFLVALRGIGLSAITANVFSYAAGLCVAYVLNMTFVFREAQHSRSTVWRFVLSFFLAYGLNLAVLYSLTRHAGWAPEIAQLFAMASYTLAFYLLNRSFVWKK